MLIGKGCHPLTAALYLKRVEGRARDGKPIRPQDRLRPDARHHATAHLPRRGPHPLRLLRHRRFLDDARRVRRRHDRRRRSPPTSCWAASTTGWRSAPTTTARSATSIRTRRCRPTTRSRRTSTTSTSSRRSAPSRAGPARRPTRTGSPATRRRSRPSTARSPTANPLESDSRLAADTISTIYSAYLSAERNGAAVDVKTFDR